jgi:hypothetical protein
MTTTPNPHGESYRVDFVDTSSSIKVTCLVSKISVPENPVKSVVCMKDGGTNRSGIEDVEDVRALIHLSSSAPTPPRDTFSLFRSTVHVGSTLSYTSNKLADGIEHLSAFAWT